MSTFERGFCSLLFVVTLGWSVFILNVLWGLIAGP